MLAVRVQLGLLALLHVLLEDILPVVAVTTVVALERSDGRTQILLVSGMINRERFDQI